MFSLKKRPALTDLKLDRWLLIWVGVQVRRPPRRSGEIGLRGPDGATGGKEAGSGGPYHKIIAPQGQRQW